MPPREKEREPPKETGRAFFTTRRTAGADSPQMKTSSRLSAIAVIAALCIAPAAFAKKPKEDQAVPGQPGQPAQPGKPGKHGKTKGQAAPGTAPAAPGAPQTQAPGPQGHRPGGPRIVVVPPPVVPPPPYRRYRQGYADYSDSTVASVQRALKSRGYYAGAIDGDAGSGTRAAIRGFRADNGLAPSSAIDAPLLRALGL